MHVRTSFRGFGRDAGGLVALLAVGVLATIWIAAKLPRTGILMYVKRPAPKQILGWLVAK